MNMSDSKSHYYVVYDGAWKIQCDGENSEPYPRKSDAFRDAVALAHLDDPQRPAKPHVIVQSEDDVPAGVGFQQGFLSAAAGARGLIARQSCAWLNCDALAAHATVCQGWRERDEALHYDATQQGRSS